MAHFYLLPRFRLPGAKPIALAAAFAGSGPAHASEEESAAAEYTSQDIMVSARRRAERAQDVPVALSPISSDLIRERGDYTISAIPQIAPSLQVFSFNPRNANISIRGLGSNVAAASDGLENGVGFYVDDVYYGCPGQAQFDLVDLERIEVLRGPRGTLFGKNTTAGALNITTKLPQFDFGGETEGSLGNYDYRQVRAALTGPLTDWAVFRVSLADTHRDGTILNLHSGKKIHGYDNFTARGQLLLRTPHERLKLRLIGDYSKQELNCCARLIHGSFTRYDDSPTVRQELRRHPARGSDRHCERHRLRSAHLRHDPAQPVLIRHGHLRFRSHAPLPTGDTA